MALEAWPGHGYRKLQTIYEGMDMAGNSGDLKAHEGTYSFFVSLLKVSTIVSVVLTAIVVLLIAN